jgi:hypothetical protein
VCEKLNPLVTLPYSVFAMFVASYIFLRLSEFKAERSEQCYEWDSVYQGALNTIANVLILRFYHHLLCYHFSLNSL